MSEDLITLIPAATKKTNKPPDSKFKLAVGSPKKLELTLMTETAHAPLDDA